MATVCSNPSSMFLLTVSRRFFFRGSFLIFVVHVCHVVLSVACCLVVTCWERADLLAFFNEMFFAFVTFPYGVLGQVWYLKSIRHRSGIDTMYRFLICAFLTSSLKGSPSIPREFCRHILS